MARNTQRSRVRTVRRLRQLRNAVASCPLGAVERESAQPSAYSLLSHERAGAVLTTRPTLRDLPYFAESASTGIPRTLRPCTPDLTMVWCPRPGAGPTDAVTAGVVLRELIDRELPGTGALLFRNLQGFGVSGANDFAQLISGLGYDLFECVPPAVPARLRSRYRATEPDPPAATLVASLRGTRRSPTSPSSHCQRSRRACLWSLIPITRTAQILRESSFSSVRRSRRMAGDRVAAPLLIPARCTEPSTPPSGRNSSVWECSTCITTPIATTTTGWFHGSPPSRPTIAQPLSGCASARGTTLSGLPMAALCAGLSRRLAAHTIRRAKCAGVTPPPARPLRHQRACRGFRSPAVCCQRRFNQITAMHASYFHSHPTYPELYGVPEPSPITLLENPQGEPYSFHTRYGDGTEIPREVITYLRNTIWSHAVGFDWCEGDLLVIDNYCVMHARRGYADTPEQRRKMYIALTDGTENS